MAVIEKEEKPIVAYTSQYKIKGNIFIPPGGRLTDYLSSIGPKRFIPLTDAIVTDMHGKEICRADFIELNIGEVIFIMPVQQVG